MKLIKRDNGKINIADKTAAGIANGILKLQHLSAMGLQVLTKSWKQKQQWVFLYLICIVFGGSSIIAIVNPFRTSHTLKIIIAKPISTTKNIHKDNKSFLITKKEFQRVREYKSAHPNLLKERPGLYDSLSLIEQIYYSQQK